MLQSLISTADPLSGSQKRDIQRFPQAFKGYAGGGDMSRGAYSRAMADMGRNTMAGAMDKGAAEYRQKAEQARSADLMAQRQLAQGRYALGREKDQITRQQDTKYREGKREIKQYRNIARRNAEQRLINNAIGAIVGTSLTAAAGPMFAQAAAGGAGLFGSGAAASGPGTGLMGLFSGGMGGSSMPAAPAWGSRFQQSTTGINPLRGLTGTGY